MTKRIMDDDIARTAGRILRRGGLTPAERKRFRAKLRAKAEAARRGGYGVRDEQNLNWFGPDHDPKRAKGVLRALNGRGDVIKGDVDESTFVRVNH